MPHYSLRLLNEDGRMTGRLQFEASSHAEAEAIAAKIPDARAKALWFGSSAIASWPARAAAEPELRTASRRPRQARA
jgi:hypothetical protein